MEIQAKNNLQTNHMFEIHEFNVSDVDSKSLCKLLLFGKPHLDVSVNKVIIEETIRSVENTKKLYIKYQ